MMIVKNSSNVTHWTLENGYSDGIGRKGYPIRVYNARHNAALNMYLQIYEQDMEYLCARFVNGFKFFLHTPGDVVTKSLPYFRISLLEQVEVSIKPTIISTSNGLRSYDPMQRQCFFESERSLRFFKSYSQHRCKIECLANFTQKVCGCVKFSMPSKKRG